MDGYTDFSMLKENMQFSVIAQEFTFFFAFLEKMGNNLPLSCCVDATDVCEFATAQSDGVIGCRSKILLIATYKSTISLYVSITVLSMQVSS